MSLPLPLRARSLLCKWWNELVYRYQHKKDWKQEIDEAHLKQSQRINESPLLFAAKENDVTSIKNLIISPSVDIFERGAVGETALHVAAFFDSLEAAVALMDAAPALINEPMNSDLYAGQTALHIAVVNQNINLLKELICRGANIITPRVTGSYFQKNTQNLVYFGEHILSFAASVGNEEIVKLLIEEGANIHAQDSLGNTVLHILVFQPNKSTSCQIFDLIMSYDKPKGGQLSLDFIQNHNGLTPFKMSAAEGNLVMFQHILNKRRVFQWCYGPLSSYLYDLTEIDSWADESSILELIVCSEKREARRILEVTPLNQLVKLKWNKYGKHYFWFLMLLYLIYITCFTLCCVFRPLKLRTDNATDPRDVTLYVQKTLQESYVTYNDHLRLIGEIISVTGAVVILLLEIPDILRVGAARYFGQTVLGGPFHVIIITYASLVLLLLILRLTSSNGETEVMAIALVLCWCNILYFARGFEMLGPYVIVIQKIIFSDLLCFIWLMSFSLVGFSTALWMPYMTQDPSQDPQFGDFPTLFFVEFELSLGLLDIPMNYSVWTPSIVKILHVALTVFTFLLMMNLLIAMMADTQWRVAQERDELWRAQVVATTVMLERRIPRCMWPRLGIWGGDYGLDKKWYFRVEDRNDNAAQKLRRYAEAFQYGINKENLDKKVGDTGESLFRSQLPTPSVSDQFDPNRKSLLGWKIIQRNTLGSDFGEQVEDREEEVYHV
ncbi:transient receptor potential cation channel subfamily V member 5-like isoform X1 [Erpetoichthys calabaricus]|uniref:transient receptor potential cation channel subfamily V member 5-like isoform X1 n=1 Tax=Erpetoichthys calabaricus TaxID=27687 RepID=UPI002234AE8E|nr:transient receptor potential cation channel subfamily V member 5-like isoform X1 [Erpetoichthys calabaricus]